MVEIEINYQGDLHCNAIHLPSKALIETDAPVDNHGRGERFSPTDLLAASLGSCMMTVMAITAQRHNIELKGAQMRVRKEMSVESPRRITSLDINYYIPQPADHPQRQLLESAACNCPVHHSLHPDINLKIQFHWIGVGT